MASFIRSGSSSPTPEQIARNCRQFGWIGFWLQAVLGLIPPAGGVGAGIFQAGAVAWGIVFPGAVARRSVPGVSHLQHLLELPLYPHGPSVGNARSPSV